MRVAAAQFQSVPGDTPANLAIVDAFTEEAATAEAVLVAFPENGRPLFDCGAVVAMSREQPEAHPGRSQPP